MELTLRSFLLFLRKLVSFFRKRWDQSTRRLWYIFAFFRSRFSPSHPKKRDEIRRNPEYRPENPPTTVICASRLPPIAGGDTPIITSPTPIPIQVTRPTLGPGDPLYETEENYSNEHLGVDRLAASGSISRSNSNQDENEYTHIVPQNEDITDSPVIPSLPISRPHSQYSHRQLHHAGYPLPSQYSQRPPSVHSYRSASHLNGAEAAARGYAPPSTRPPSPVHSVRPPSIAGSVRSQAYRAPRPTGRARVPSPMRNISRRRGRSSTPASTRHNAHEVPPPPQSGSQTPVSANPGPHSTTVSFGPIPNPRGVLRPMIGIDRYEKHKLVVVEDEIIKHVFPPVTTEFVRDSIPDNWVPLMHPEGALYWVHDKDPIYTDTNMCDPELRERIEEAIEELERLMEISPTIPEDWELALELGTDEETGEYICSYYFVRLSTRCLFWFHDFDLDSVLLGLCGVTEKTHIHLALQTQYWSHWEMFPHNREVPETLVRELTGILLHAGIDCMTSPNSTAIYSEGDLNKILGYVRQIKSVGGNCGFSACVVGRLMNFFTSSRYMNFYGQKGARLTNDQTIYGFQPRRTYLIRVLSVFFFYAPELHLRGLESVYTDFIICQHRWQLFITRLQTDWAEFILYGTVLLNANVAFLAIPSVDPGNHIRTPAQLASYLSVITSIGSIVIGLLLLRQHRTKPQDAAEEVDNYLRSRHRNALGFETLAILYSLPYSLLLWSTIAFTTAFGLEALLFSSETWARLPVGAVLAMMTLLILWCVGTTVEAKTDFSALSTLVDFTRKLRGKTSESETDTGDGGGSDGRDVNRTTLRDALNLRLRKHRPSTSSTLVNRAESKGPCSPPGGTEVEMGGINNMVLANVV